MCLCNTRQIRLSRSLRRRRDDDLPSSDEVFHNPVDGRAYAAPGGWRLHSPGGQTYTAPGGLRVHSSDDARPEGSAGGVTLGLVRLLAPEADFESRTSKNDMVTFMREAVRLAEDSLASSGKQFQVMVQFKCRPDGHDVELAYQPEDAPQERLQQYFDALMAAERLPVSHGELSFQLEISADP